MGGAPPRQAHLNFGVGGWGGLWAEDVTLRGCRLRGGHVLPGVRREERDLMRTVAQQGPAEDEEPSEELRAQ